MTDPLAGLRDRYPPRKDPPGPLVKAQPVARKPARAPAPKKPLPKVHPERAAQRKAVQEGPQFALCKKRSCCACGGGWGVTGHHVTSRGAGGLDEDCAPLCIECHSVFHAEGIDGLKRRHGEDVDLDAAVLAMRAEVAARAARGHDCEERARLIEDGTPGRERCFYRCEVCGYVLPDEQEDAPA